jgi:hypothetical protein
MSSTKYWPESFAINLGVRDVSRYRPVMCSMVGDRAYDSDPLDEELRNDGIEMIAPHRSNRRKPATQDRRRLSRYMRRWLVERFHDQPSCKAAIYVSTSALPR